MGSGDAVIGINPATDSPAKTKQLIELLNAFIERFNIPTQSCVLSHVTTTMALITHDAPVDLVFQSIGGTQATNESFGINLSMLKESRDAALELKRGSVGNNVMYFETGQGSSLSANAHHGLDQQTCEARAYAVARAFDPLLVNSVVGFIGPNICTMQNRLHVLHWKIISVANCSDFPWAWTFAIPTMRMQIKTIWIIYCC